MSESHMRLHFLLLLLLFCFSHSSLYNFNDPVVGLVTCGPRQIQALTQFKNEFDSRSCNLNHYFDGVWCDNMTGAITKILLPSSCLSGTLKPKSILFGFNQLRYLDLGVNNFISSSLPSEFGKLNKLEVLYLDSNGFLGPIPSSFSNLSMLSFLDLSRNELTGSFQLVRNLSKLTYLGLSHNHFSGILDSNNGLFELHQLRYLDIGYNNFTSSTLPYKFSNLNKLELLDLSSNDFSGQVPPTISNLTLLTELYLSHNKLTGRFPLVQNLTKLYVLELTDNQFSGAIPSFLFTMPFLSHLYLNENNLSGSIEIHNSSSLSMLERLYLGNNHFGRKILEPIANLINLKELELSFLNTSYPIDLNIFSSLKSLLLLDVSGNRISQASLSLDSYIPSTLEALILRNCDISGFPKIIKRLHNLVGIDTSNNRISGKIPNWLWSLPCLYSVFTPDNFLNGFEGSPEVLVNSSVQILSLDSNRFEGLLPHLPLFINFFTAKNNSFRGNIRLSICNRSLLSVLDLSYNNFTGLIPPCLSNILILKLRKNNLEGNIPDNFYADAPLQRLDVGYNRLTGTLPRSLRNCSSLQFLSVANNGIKDTFPFSLNALPNFQVLILSTNKFYGCISPPNHGPLGFPKLRVLEIAGNEFTGSLPSNFFVDWKALSLAMNEDVGLYMLYDKDTYSIYHYRFLDLIDLQYKGLSMKQERVFTFFAAIDFSGNRFEGKIPESIGLLKALIALNLSNNAFTSHIPLSLANLTKLESLDLSGNQLSGTIPNGLGSLSFLEYINVSHNQLKGEIPQGTQITGQSKSSFEGNAGLCGFPLDKVCFETNLPPPAHEPLEEEDERVLNWKAAAIVYGPGVLFGLAIAQLIASYKPEWVIKIIGPNKPRNH